jgi:uncharacterized membrane protein YkvA (DUF1232 family)
MPPVEDLPDLPGFYQRWRERVYQWIRARGPAALADAILLLPDLVALTLRLIRDPRTPLPFKAQLLAVSIYALSPIDIIPEAAFGAMGLADDVLLLSLMLLRLLESASQIDPDLIREHWAGKGDVVETLQEVVQNKGELVNTKLWNSLRRLFGDTPPDPAVVQGQARPE